jgi:hypothetical protein
VMHDTCNTANLVAKQVQVLRDDVGKNMYGVEEWKAMQQDGSGWQYFLCGNHSRNLHFDAFNRCFTNFTKSVLGDGMALCKVTILPLPSQLCGHSYRCTPSLKLGTVASLTNTPACA